MELIKQLAAFGSTKWLQLDVGSFAFALCRYALIVAPLEWFWGRQKNHILFRPQWATDFVYLVVNILLNTITLMPFIFILLQVRGLFGNTKLNELVHSWPIAAQVLFALFLGDLLGYWAHRLSHRLEGMWRFHRIHHSSLIVDWMAGFRVHLVDYTWIRLSFIIPPILLGLDSEVAAFSLFAIQISGFLQHLDVPIRLPIFERFFMTPFVHHWHHGVQNKRHMNYAHLFPIIDILFGTYHLPALTVWPKFDLGVAASPLNPGYFSQAIAPFTSLHPKKEEPR